MSQDGVSEVFDVQSHRLRSARYVASENCDERPNSDDISLLVIHNISLPPGQFGGPYIDQLFTNALKQSIDDDPYFSDIVNLKVSSHLLIRRDGEVVQYVPFDQRAWHAGVSNYAGRERCNDFSIGIELEGCDDQLFEDVQYETLAAVTKVLFEAYEGLNLDRIAGHSDIAPGRKTDPGPCFDWQRFRQLLV